MQADTIAAAAERAGKKVAQIDWVGGAQADKGAPIAGPTVDFVNFFSTRGVLAAPLDATQQAGAAAFGSRTRWHRSPLRAAGATSRRGDPATRPGDATHRRDDVRRAEPTRVYDVYVYDSVVNGTAAYDHAILVRSAAAKDGSLAAVNLAVGDFKEIKLTGADGLIGARAGQTAGFYASSSPSPRISPRSSSISPPSSA